MKIRIDLLEKSPEAWVAEISIMGNTVEIPCKNKLAAMMLCVRLDEAISLTTDVMIDRDT